MTLVDMWREEGMEKGGTEALSQMAIRLLTTVPEEVRNAISKLDMVKVGVLIEEIFEFLTIDDIKKYIQ